MKYLVVFWLYVQILPEMQNEESVFLAEGNSLCVQFYLIFFFQANPIIETFIELVVKYKLLLLSD